MHLFQCYQLQEEGNGGVISRRNMRSDLLFYIFDVEMGYSVKFKIRANNRILDQNQLFIIITNRQISMQQLSIHAFAPSSIHISFSAKVFTQFKQKVYIIGSHPSLGSWDISQAHQLQTSPQSFPQWSSPFSLSFLLNTTFQFKCIKINSNNQIIWEPICINRKHTIVNSETISLEFGVELESTMRKEIYRHESSVEGEGMYEFEEPEKFRIVRVERGRIRRDAFIVKQYGMELKETLQIETEEFLKNQVHETKCFWYIRNLQLLEDVNKYHDHLLSICYDCRGGTKDLGQLLKCKMVLFDQSKLLEEYMRYVEGKGYSIWMDKGSLVVWNSYGYQVAIISKYEIEGRRKQGEELMNAKQEDDAKERKSQLSINYDVESLFKEYRRWISLLKNGYKLISREIPLKIQEQFFLENTIIIYSDPLFPNLPSSLLTKLRTILISHTIHFLLPHLPPPSLFNDLFPDIPPSHLCTVPLSSPAYNPDHIKELKQRFLAQNIFDLVYDSEFMVTLLHKYPRMFNVEIPFYEEELKRYPCIKSTVRENRIKLRGGDVNQCVKNIMEEKEIIGEKVERVVLVGSDSVLREITEEELEVEILRIGSIKQLERLLNK